MNNHVKKVKAMIDSGEISARDIPYLNIYHDPTCSLLNRRGPCDCDPVVQAPPMIPVTGVNKVCRSSFWKSKK